MRHLVLMVLMLGLCVASSSAIADDNATADDAAAIKKAIASYVDTFNKADAKALAGHWTEKGEFITPGGKTLRGREQLAAEFSAEFAESSKMKLELVGTQVEVVSPSVAVETGVARVIVADEEPRETEYKAIHVKTAEGWKIDSVREADTPSPPPSHYEQLQSLEWMIGTWTDADENGSVETTCHWTTNRNFITRSFNVNIDGVIDFEGTQIIGWDPAKQTIRSWLFDSDGGFAVGRWTEESGRWVVHTLSVLPDGRRASSTNTYEPIDDGKVRFRSVGRQVDGQLLPNVGPVEIVRKEE